MSEEYVVPHSCEYHKPNLNKKNEITKTTNRKRKRLQLQDQIETHPPGVFPRWSRSELFSKEWQKINEKIDEKIIDLFNVAIESVWSFIQNETDQCNGLHFNKIPTAIMVLNSPSIRKKVIDNLESRIGSNEQESTIIVELDSYHDSMRSIFQALRGKIKNFEQGLCNTVEDILKSLVQDEKNKKLVIIIHDFEKFNMFTLYKLILVLKTFTLFLSTALILFKNNLLDANLNNHLSMDVVECLSVKIIFEGYRKDKILSSLLEEIVFDRQIRFKFHPDLLEKLTGHLQLVEFSIEYLKNLLRSHLFNYFFFNPLSAICSLKLDLETLKNENIVDCFKNSLNIPNNFSRDEEYVEFLHNSYQEMIEKNAEFTLQLKILSKLFKYLDLPMQSFTVLYFKVYSSPNYISKENRLSCLYGIGQNKMNQALEKLKLKFEKMQHSLLGTISAHQKQLENLINQEKIAESKQSESIRKLGLENQLEMVKDKLRNINSRSEWRKSMKPAEKINLSQYEQWKNCFIESLEQAFVKHPLANFKPLVDGLFCNTSVISHMSCRQNLDLALTKPVSGTAMTRMGDAYPSFYILYRFYKEANNGINLQEWFEKYSQEKKLNREKSATAETKKELMALFLNTILDFEHVGLLKCSSQNKYTKVIYL